MSPPITSLDEHKPGDTLKARVLYIDPSTKLVHLTLRDITPAEPPELNIGDKCPSTVLSHCKAGIYIQLKNGAVGLVTYRRLARTVKLNEASSNIGEIMRKKYRKGLKRMCRILGYSYIDKLYVATFEKDVLNEERWCIGDLTAGQIGDGVVTQIQENGIQVMFGKVAGFVQNVHLSNAPYSENIKKKFKVGQKVKAR